MLAAGHCAPTCYALWMIMGEALARKYKATGDAATTSRPTSRCCRSTRSASGAAPARWRRCCGQRPRRPSAVRAGEGPRHPRALRTHRIHRRHQRRQRRPLGRRHRDGGRQGRVLGHRRRADRPAEDRRVRRRVRHVRRPRAGTEDAGDRAADRQAAAHVLLRQQRRHRRCAHRRRGAQQVRRLQAGRSVDVVRLERLHDPRRPRLRADPRTS